MKVLSVRNDLFCLRKVYKTDSAESAPTQAPFKIWQLWCLMSVLAVLASATPVKANEAELGVSCQTSLQNSTSSGSTVRTLTNTNAQLEKVNSQFSVLNIDDWRKNPKIPWSVPVIVNDPFDGKYLAVFDRNFKDGAGVITNWSRNCIRIVVYENIPYYNGYSYGSLRYDQSLYGTLTTTAEAKTLEIKLGNQIFQINGRNGTFLVDNRMAAALRAAPSEKAIIRITLEGSGASIVSNIGPKTVKAWKSVY